MNLSTSPSQNQTLKQEIYKLPKFAGFLSVVPVQSLRELTSLVRLGHPALHLSGLET